MANFILLIVVKSFFFTKNDTTQPKMNIMAKPFILVDQLSEEFFHNFQTNKQKIINLIDFVKFNRLFRNYLLFLKIFLTVS